VKEIERMRTGEKIVPRFVIEVISKNDGINEVNDKLDEYFNAGVRLAWLVFPKSKMIQIYHPNGSNERLRGSSVCSAESVIPGFVFAVEEILK
jgi:Uma2 family endonuclease